MKYMLHALSESASPKIRDIRLDVDLSSFK